MKKIFCVLFVFCFCFLASALAHSAVYEVAAGDNLTIIAKKTNYSVVDLLALNEDIGNPDEIYLGQEIKFLSGLDIRDAWFLAVSRTENMQHSDKEYPFYSEVARMIEKGEIGSKKGLHPAVIIELAEEWRKEQVSSI